MIFFLNSTNRVYNDRELNEIPKLLFSNGVFNTLQLTHALWQSNGDFLVLAAGTNMTITCNPGAASMPVTSNGKTQQIVIQEDLALSATVSNNTLIANRNDAVVLRVLQSVITGDTLNAAGSNAVALTVVAGSSATPLTDAQISIALSGDPFIRLANLNVPLNDTAISQNQLTDARTLATMSRSLRLASDSFQFYGLAADPANPAQGQVWYNTTDGILKMFNGVSTIALQTQDFSFGYYPPGGVDQNNNLFTPTDENAGLINVTTRSFSYTVNTSFPPGFTTMEMQVIKMPNILKPYFQIKMGNPDFQASVKVEVWTLDGSYNPVSLVESLAEIPAGSVPRNDYINAFLTQTYTPGTNYGIILKTSQLGVFPGTSSNVTGQVQVSQFTADGTFLGSNIGSVATVTTSPTVLSWNGLDASNHFVMRILDRQELPIAQTDTTGKNHIVQQSFISKSKDMRGFQVLKGTDILVPTGDLTASLYVADINGNPTGSILASGIITNATWETGASGTAKNFPIAYDKLSIGQRYVVVITCSIYNDTNNYTIYLGGNLTGTAKRQTTSDGTIALNGDFFFGILISANKKIVVTDTTGFIPANLIPKILPVVASITSSATPAYQLTSDCLSITALATNITDMSANAIGTGQDFQRFEIRIKDNGSSRTINWGALYENKGASLPGSTTAGKTHTIVTEFNVASGKFGCISAVVEA